VYRLWGLRRRLDAVPTGGGNPAVHLDLLIPRPPLVDEAVELACALLVEGHVQGGIAHSIGQVLYEQTLYDEDGQLLTGEFMDYAMPRAADIPEYILGSTETPSPVNPLGVKGVGEAGTIGATPAIANAVMDALEPLGVTHLDLPLTPERVWRAIQSARSELP